MIRSVNKKKLSLKKKLFSINCLFIISLFFLVSSECSFGQNLSDSLKKDSVIILHPPVSDTIKKFTPVEKLFEGKDTSKYSAPKKNPKKAAILSAVLPGLGQAYNGKYWKIPIIYSIFATMYFIGEDNNNKYQLFKKAYAGEDVDAINREYYTEDRIKEYKDYYKRNRDLDIIIGFGLYLLNILDASVDANLMDYDISTDLSLKIQPEYKTFYGYQNLNRNSSFGLKFVLSF